MRRSRQECKENVGGVLSPHAAHMSGQGEDSSRPADVLQQSRYGANLQNVAVQAQREDIGSNTLSKAGREEVVCRREPEWRASTSKYSSHASGYPSSKDFGSKQVPAPRDQEALPVRSPTAHYSFDTASNQGMQGPVQKQELTEYTENQHVDGNDHHEKKGVTQNHSMPSEMKPTRLQ